MCPAFSNPSYEYEYENPTSRIVGTSGKRLTFKSDYGSDNLVDDSSRAGAQR